MATSNEVLDQLAELVASKSGGSFGSASRDQRAADIRQKANEAREKADSARRFNANKKLIKELDDLAEAAEDAADNLDDQNEELKTNTTRLVSFGSVVKNITRDFIKLGEQEARYAMQFATADAGWIDGVTQMGISQLEYMKLLKQTRIEGLAAASAGVDFKESLISSQNSLIGLTSSTEEAAKVSGMFHKNMARIGVSQQDLGDAVSQQTKIYEENYRALGYSAEEFANLSAELINDQGMRGILLTLQEKERKAYVLGIQQRMAEYQTMGYTIERAKELQKTFQALHGMDPKERMKQAAKKRAMMGAMGMGGEAAELFDLEIRYRTMTAEQKKDADIRMAEIQGDAAKVFGEMSGSGSGIGQAMVMQMMANKTGFDKVAQTFETETGLGMKIDEKQLAATNEIPEIMKDAITVMDHWGAAQHSAVFSIGTNIIKELGSIIMTAAALTAAGSLFKGGGVGGMMKSVGGMFGKALTVIKGIAGPIALLATTFGVAYGAGSLINEAMPEDWKTAIGDTIGPWIDFASMKLFDDKDAKARLDKHAVGGNYSPTINEPKTETEMAAAAAAKAKTLNTATITTPTKAGIDAATEKTEEYNKELLSTLQELQAYLKTTNHQSSEQTKNVEKLGTAISDATRVAGMRG